MSQTSNEWAGEKIAQGRYLVRAQLGEGGMGFVYRALDRNLESDVVIKVPRRSMLDDPGFAPRFAREVRSLVKLAHPNIVKVTDVGEHDGMPFAVMQYLSGGSLEDYAAGVRDGSTFAARLGALRDWLPGVAAALDFVHSQGYVHRDVKPGNILFDAHGHVFLSDFGVAKVLAAAPEAPSRRNQTAVTGAGMVLGTPEYMAPELIMGQPFDGRIDQYALAVTVYEMLGGRRPFEAASPTACMVMQTTRDPAPLRLVESRVSRDLSDAVQRALSKDPALRFPTCAAFAAAVAAASEGDAAGGVAGTAPPGQESRPDQVRLQCPCCAKSLIFPAALLADPQKVRGKRVSCPSCQARLRVSDDGLSLRTTSLSSSSGIHAPPLPSEGTRKLVAPRSATVPTARPAAPQTARQTPPPGPRPVTPGPVAPTPAGGPPSPARAVPVWGIAAGAAVVVLAASVFVAIVVIPERRVPRPGLVLVDTADVPPGASFSLDGRRVDAGEFRDRLALPAGVHELAVTKAGFRPFSRLFPVAPGEETGFKAILEREPTTPTPTPTSEKTPEALAANRTVVAPPAAPRPLPAPAPAPLEVASGDDPGPESGEETGPPLRAERPAPTPDAFVPGPDGPPVETNTLAALLNNPPAYAAKAVVPTGLFVLGPVSFGQNGSVATTTVTRVTLRATPNNLASLANAEAPEMVHVDLQLAKNLGGLANPRVYQPANTIVGHWVESACVLTFHVEKRSDRGPDAWVPVLKNIEFLVGMNFQRVGRGNFKDAFRTLVVTATSLPSSVLSDRHDWKTRLGAPYCSQLKRISHSITDARWAEDMQEMNAAMAPVINNAIRNNISPAEIQGNQMRRFVPPR